MKAKLIYHDKKEDGGYITEVIIWELPTKTPDRPHGMKYRCFHGKKSGRCIVRYDNETGKGDHKHIGTKELPYEFTSVEQLMLDFISDIRCLTREEK
jgi:hypothetical protein